ncbi:uncharacterized protein LOC135838178 [Planococcus citri]|uniref:uncharacterized protein LOC135838178 n=1 Tax=Planococcus citri TaxID=170843 RepID=UPI0031FA2D46
MSRDSDRIEFLWVGVFILSVYGASTLIANSWQRYNSNPTVIAIQKNYREWNITFPAATFCFLDNVDEQSAKNFINRTWGIVPIATEEADADYGDPEETEETTPDANITTEASSTVDNEAAHIAETNQKYKYYLTFLKNLANMTYENLNVFEQYVDDDTINQLDMKKTILEVIRQVNQQSTFFNKEFKNREFLQTLTEMGICYTHGGVVSDYITITGVPHYRPNFQLPTCNFLNTLCYSRTEGIPSDVRYYVHSPNEIPDISSSFFKVSGRMDRDTSFTVLETTVSPEINRLNPSQRKCRFEEEPTIPHMKVYSFNLCRMQCRKEKAFELCGCAPYFYQKEHGIPVCGIKGLVCLSKYSEELINLRMSNGEKLECNCLPQCINNRYFVDREVVRQWSFPVPYDIRFRWAIEKFSKIRLRRDVIFSFEDLVVSFGGTAAFFLGCSVLSFVEIIYFFTLRLIWFVFTKEETTKNKSN